MLTERQPHLATPPPAPGSQSFFRRHIWWFVGIAVVAFSAAFVRWTGTRPGYDPYGWLIWGYQTLHLNLDLGGAPSWKPLPLLFTVPYSLFGHYALWLWMVTCVSVSFAGSIFAGRIAYRIVGGGRPEYRYAAIGAAIFAGRIAYRIVGGGRPEYRYAAIGAAIFAGLGMYGIQDNINGAHSSYMHYLLSVQSDPMIVAIILAAIDLHMTKHRRWVIAMLTLASLGRPESWPFLFLYSIWCWREFPETRRFVAASWLLTAFLWFGIPTITNGRPLVAGDLAQGSPRELHQNKIIGTIDRFKTLNLWPVWVFALVGVAWSGYRLSQHGFRLKRYVAGLRKPGSADELDSENSNQLLVILLAAGVVLWLIVEVAFALHGWPAVPRYIFPPAVVAILIGAVAFGWLLREIPRGLKLPAWSGMVLAAALALAIAPGALSRIRLEHKDIRHERLRTKDINHLTATISALGGRDAVLRCGRPVSNVEYVSILGWLTHQNDGKIGHRPQFELHNVYPIVLFTQLPNGWATYPWHTAQRNVAFCQRMKALDIFTKGHPNGVVSVNNVAPKLTSYKGAQAPTPTRSHG